MDGRCGLILKQGKGVVLAWRENAIMAVANAESVEYEFAA